MMRSSGLILYICAGLLLSGGIILGGSTAWSLLRMSYYFWLSDFGIELGAGMVFISGALLCLPACWIATMAPYHPRSLPLLGSLMCLVSVAMLLMATGLNTTAALARTLCDPSVLNNSMSRAMSYDGFDYAVRSSFASIQAELKCCGVQSYNDWYPHRRTLPPACCGRVWNGKRGEPCTEPLYSQGCLRPALAELRTYLHSVSTLAYSIVFVLAVTLIASAYTLVINVAERGESRSAKQFGPLRIACLASQVPLNSNISLAQHRALAPLSSAPILSPIASAI